MFADLRELEPGSELAADLCIVGAGAAGIAIARRFVGTPLEVLLLESGGLEFESDTQELYRGEVRGESYYDLRAARLRAFGGSTNHWTGHLGRLRAADLAPRPWDPWSGWPLAATELEPYYEPALAVFRTPAWHGGPEPLTPIAPADAEAPSPDRLEVRYRGSSAGGALRFGDAYRAELGDAANVRVLLHANLTELHSDDAGGAVQRAEVATLEGRRAGVRARAFVLACGGLENPRLLLASNRVEPHGLGNRHGLVGRFFQEHPIWEVGQVIGPTRLLSALQRRAAQGARGLRDLCPTPALIERHRLLDFGVQIDSVSSRPWDLAGGRNRPTEGDAAADLATVLPWLTAAPEAERPEQPPAPGAMRRCSVQIVHEPQPRPENAVSLGDERDALGMRRLVLDLGFGEADDRTLERAVETVVAELGRRGVGRVVLAHERADERPTRRYGWHGASHHIGTTRMADDPTRGVVDRDCRVHGVANLWIAGSSVFPTSGYVNPTLTLVALGLRLADHLRAKLG